MGSYRFVLVKPAARPAYPLFGVLPFPATVPVQALLVLGTFLILLIVLAAYSDMLKPGLLAASRLHPYTPSASSSDKSHSLRRPRSTASASSSRASSSSRARLSNPKYKGLRNTGNTCFFNSTLQSISSLSLFRKYLYFLVQQAERWDTYERKNKRLDVEECRVNPASSEGVRTVAMMVMIAMRRDETRQSGSNDSASWNGWKCD